MTERPISGYLQTDLGVYPDERCDSTAIVEMPHGTDFYETQCALHHEHDPHVEPHADGTGAFWGDDGEVEFR
jgi:hypothetical protein